MHRGSSLPGPTVVAVQAGKNRSKGPEGFLLVGWDVMGL